MKSYPKSKQLSGKPKKEPVARRRKRVEKQLEEMVKRIIFWRDGLVCVQQNQGGCNEVLTWGHLTSRKQSKRLKYDLGNGFSQCQNHNLKDYRGDKGYVLWFVQTFGTKALEILQANKLGKVHPVDLEAQLAHYDKLYQDRIYVNPNLPELVAKGYYGEFVRQAWIEEGKIAQ